MPDSKIIEAVQKYLAVLNEHGIPAERAILFGSRARGTGDADSDIDILVVSSQFDEDRWACEADLWRWTLEVDPRIEPIPVGERQLVEDGVSPIIEMARREGIEICREERTDGVQRVAETGGDAAVEVEGG